MLEETDKPQALLNDTRTQIPIAWKTGTSSGFHDAWTAGIVGPYVLTVWIGNFNNQSNPAFIGKEIAAPLFFEIISALRDRTNLKHNFLDMRGLHLTQVDVCKVSGMLPNHYCPETEKPGSFRENHRLRSITFTVRSLSINAPDCAHANSMKIPTLMFMSFGHLIYSLFSNVPACNDAHRQQ